MPGCALMYGKKSPTLLVCMQPEMLLNLSLTSANHNPLCLLSRNTLTYHLSVFKCASKAEARAQLVSIGTDQKTSIHQATGHKSSGSTGKRGVVFAAYLAQLQPGLTGHCLCYNELFLTGGLFCWSHLFQAFLHPQLCILDSNAQQKILRCLMLEYIKCSFMKAANQSSDAEANPSWTLCKVQY